MVICQYFLRGNCRYGDQCRNEHRRPDNRGSYNQGGRGQRNYQQDSRNFNSGGRYGNSGGRYGNSGGRYGDSGGRNTGGGQYNRNPGYDDRNYENYNQGYRNQRNYDDDHGYSGGGGYRDGGRDTWHGGNQGDRSYSKDKYHYDARNKNRYSALSHQPDPEPPSFHESRSRRDRSQSTTSHHSGTLDQKVDRVRKDMREWQENGQWPLSCYAPFASEPCLDGLLDVSPEEMRNEAYKANSTGNAPSYTQTLQQTVDKYRQRKQDLATMSSSTLQDEISRSSQPSSSVPGGLFGNLDSSQSQTSLFGESMSTSSSGLFGPSQQSMSTSGPFSSNATLANPSTTPSAPFGFSSSPFGSTQVSNTPSVVSMSGISQELSSSALTSTDGARSSKLQSLRCSEEDLKAFKAQYFVLGAIPECPPPPELC